MEAASLERTTVEIPSNDGKVTLRATGQVVTFDGFLRVYQEGRDERSRLIAKGKDQGFLLSDEIIAAFPNVEADVAKQAGVTLSTVSYVLSGKRSISAATRQRVLDAMQRGVTIGQVRAAVAQLKANGIRTGMFFMWGYEGEDTADIEATARQTASAGPVSISRPA